VSFGRAPAFQFYARDWLADPNVLLMDWDAQGMHVHLMCIAWQADPPCTIPADDDIVRRYCLDPSDEVWAKVRPQIMRAWSLEGSRLVHLGLLQNHKEQKAFNESRRANARSGWARRRRESNASAEHSQRTQSDLHSASASASADESTSRAREKPKPWIAFSGKRLQVTRDDEGDMVRQIGSSGFDLTGFLQSLDDELERTGEPYDRKWVWDRFKAATADLFGDRRSQHPSVRRILAVNRQNEQTPEEIRADLERVRERQRRDDEAMALATEIVDVLPDDERDALRAEAIAEIKRRAPRMGRPPDDAMVRHAMAMEILAKFRGRKLEDVLAEYQRRRSEAA
jgi:uncharacterized protein YdaU (DUF1376 family)